MKTLYLDCGLGACGDMLTSAILNSMDSTEEIVQQLNAMGLDGVTFELESVLRNTIAGSHLKVTDSTASHTNATHSRSLANVEEILNGLQIEDAVRQDAREVYQLLAEAEGIVHGVEPSEVHFHEVGDMDSIGDIVAFCMLIHELKVDQILASPLTTGQGQLTCSHGTLPIPAPATAVLLRGIPAEQGTCHYEGCTPTGVALLKHFVTSFQPMPRMRIEKIGYGMGTRNDESVSFVRALLGETEASTKTTIELNFNVDDMTAEDIAFASQQLFDLGATEVFTIPVHMKKNRPGTWFQVFCNTTNLDAIIQGIFRNTSTLGIRRVDCTSYVMDRSIETVETVDGPVRRKVAHGYGTTKSKWEYEDLAKIAKEKHVSIEEVRKELETKNRN